MPQLDIEQIKQILPHRYPFLLIDRVVDYSPGEWAQARKCVTTNEQFFEGHFPKQAVMPGVLILEALAQTGAIALLSEAGMAGSIALFGGVKNARFKKVVVPGDVLDLECRLTKRWGPVGYGVAKATVDGKLVCQAEISFMLPSVGKEAAQKGGEDKRQATGSNETTCSSEVAGSNKKSGE